MRQPIAYLRKQRGLSIVELMVAVTLGLVLLAGVIQIFVSNKQTYRVQEATARVQENGRIATQLLTQDVRMADYWGCAQASTSTNVFSDVPPGSTIDLDAGGIAGTNDDGVNGSDTITLQGAYGSGISVQPPFMPTTAAALQVTAGAPLKEDDIIMVSDCASSDIFQITNINPNGSDTTIVHNTGGTSLNITGDLSKTYSGDAQIYRMRTIAYSIQNDATTGEPGLFRSENGAAAQMLVEGIEDMQILYGEDTNGDRTANRYVDAASVADWEAVVSVRPTLTARTEDRVTAEETGEGDRRLRRDFTSTVTVRNRIVER